MQNTVIAAEETITLDLVMIVLKNVGLDDYGMLKVHADCKVVCDLLIAKRSKAIQLALDGGSMISKIIEIEKIVNHNLNAFM